MMYNFVGGPEQVLLRENVKVYDYSVYITAWITMILLEAALLPGGPDLEEEQLSLALDAITLFHDFNEPKGSSVMVFWPQEFNETTELWVQNAPNFSPILADEKILSDVMTSLLNDLGLKDDSEYLREITDNL